MNEPKVYLAGGLSSSWRDTVKNKCTGFSYFDPKAHGLEGKGPLQYTTWDMFHVKACDILFGYMEESNTSGYGLSVEVGYASALGKLVVVVDERSINDEGFSQKFAIVNSLANVQFACLNDGIDFLSRFGKL